ncbi:MAG: acyl carrier protein [Nitrospiraceae bacterium]|nr:acyl carrier protein [Nitrospiraceae bacterium]
MDIKENVKKFIQSELVTDRKFADLQDKDPLISTGIIDSLGIMRLTAFLEKSFAVRIHDEEIIAENFGTVESISALIQKKLP